jgi:hypothetical protein
MALFRMESEKGLSRSFGKQVMMEMCMIKYLKILLED